MAHINKIETESIQAGLAGAPPLATVDLWPSLDPTAPFTLQTFGINNHLAITNQLGPYFGIGAQSITGVDFVLGLNMNLGISNDTVPSFTGAAPNWGQSSPNGNFFGKLDVIGGLFKNGVPVQVTSDIKLKTNIKPLENSLDKVLQLRGVEYDRIDYGNHEIGMIAQEVEQVIPDLVQEDSEGTKVLHYQNLTAVLVEAIKEQQEQINTLKQTVQELSTKLENCCP
jgi:hypothetical protein